MSNSWARRSKSDKDRWDKMAHRLRPCWGTIRLYFAKLKFIYWLSPTLANVLGGIDCQISTQILLCAQRSLSGQSVIPFGVIHQTGVLPSRCLHAHSHLSSSVNVTGLTQHRNSSVIHVHFTKQETLLHISKHFNLVLVFYQFPLYSSTHDGFSWATEIFTHGPILKSRYSIFSDSLLARKF